MKRWKKRLGYAVAILILLTALLVWDGRVLAMIRFVGNAHQPGLDHDFEKLEELLPIPGAELVELYEGLPHPYFERDEFVRDLWLTSNQSIHGYRFKTHVETPLPAVRAALADLLSMPETFRPYRGPKACGGYHADFAVTLENLVNRTTFLVCLGCREVLIYSNGKELICEFEGEDEEKLREAWNDQLGVPFESFGSRLPVDPSALADWGLVGRLPWNSRKLDSGAFVREQRLAVEASKRGPGDATRSFRVTEESYGSADEAERRSKEFSASAEQYEARRGSPYPELGFAFESKFYRVYGREGVQEELLRLLQQLRDYCDSTRVSEVRSYDW